MKTSLAKNTRAGNQTSVKNDSTFVKCALGEKSGWVHKNWVAETQDDAVAKVAAINTENAVRKIVKVAKAGDGPFGIEQGMKIKSFKTAKKIKPFIYSISPKKSHPSFQQYILTAHPNTGVCRIMAVGKAIAASAYGSELRNHFNKIRGQIVQAYGNSNVFDNLRTGSIWGEPRDWMMGLKTGERYLQAVWEEKCGSTMKGNVRDILLTARALETDKGYLHLQYNFNNADECDAAIENSASSVF